MNPEIAGRDCEDCKRYLYDDRPDRMGKRVERPKGVPVPRVKGPAGRPRCEWCPKIPTGDAPIPENAIELNNRNWRAYQHYLECKAVGVFPDDPIVKRNASLFRQLEDQAAESRAAGLNARGVLQSLLTFKNV